MNTKKKVIYIGTPLLIVLVGVGTLASCSNDEGATPIPAPSVSATASPSESPIPSEPDAPDVNPADTGIGVDADTAAGTLVPADQVEAYRDAGVNVYVPVSGGDAVVVVKGQPLPDSVAADLRATFPAAIPTSLDDQLPRSQADEAMIQAINAAGVPVVTITGVGSYDASGNLIETFYVAGILGLQDKSEMMSTNKSQQSSADKAGAVASAQALAAQYGASIIDLT